MRDIGPVIGTEIHHLLERTLREISETLEFDSITGLPNKNRLLLDLRKKGSFNPERFICLQIENQQELILNLGQEIKISIIHHVVSLIELNWGNRIYQLEENIIGIITDKKIDADTSLPGLHEQVSNPFIMNGRTIQLAVRIAMVQLQKQIKPEEMLQQGLLGLYQAQKEKKRHFFLDREEVQKAHRRLDLVHQLTEALKHERFEIVYQPILSQTKKVVAMEALSRWKDEEGNQISPDVFIHLIEDSGQMIRFQNCIVKKVLEERKLWISDFPDIQVFINISPHAFTEGFEIETLLTTLEEYDVTPESVGFEITESVLSGSGESVIQALNDLYTRGWHVAMDDFGTGYTNFERILELPFNKIKFDKSLLNKIESDIHRHNLLEFLISYFRKQNKHTVIEGIETAEQFQMLSNLGCDQFQGYFFLKPAPVSQIIQYIKDEK